MSSAKINVLFVDDEAKLLQGLRRMLRGMRDEWDMAFANSGKEALAHMATNEIDVVVTDMRMPEMTGAELLSEVSHRYPETIRIVLSGYAENETVIKIVWQSHKYLAKPCDANALIETVRQSVALRRRFRSSKMRAFVTGLTTLPVLPNTYLDLVGELAKPSATTDSVAAIIERDISLSATILKLTNSAYFSLPARILGIRQAVQLLGIDTIRSLVLLAKLFEPVSGDSILVSRFARLRDEALSTSALARKIAQRKGLPSEEIEQAGCAGLLCHLGYVLFLQADAAANAAGDMECAGAAADLDAEREIFGTTHAEVGAYMLSLWGFSEPIIEAVLCHHDLADNNEKPAGPTDVIRISQALVSKFRLDVDAVDDCDFQAGLPHDGPMIEEWIAAWGDTAKEIIWKEAVL